MKWMLEDLFTSVPITFTERGEWCVGRKKDNDETFFAESFEKPMRSDLGSLRRIDVPFPGNDQNPRHFPDMHLISREHGVFGIDKDGPHFTDNSVNKTLIEKKGEKYYCIRGRQIPLYDGDIISLGISYQIQLRNISWQHRFLEEIKKYFGLR